MRQITIDSVNAFLNDEKLNRQNMAVGNNEMRLHGNLIAKKENGSVYISNCGWETTTTKERLNGLLMRIGKGQIFQKDFSWYWSYDGETTDFPSNEFVKVR